MTQRLRLRSPVPADRPALDRILRSWLGDQAPETLERIWKASTETHLVAVDDSDEVRGVMGFEVDDIDPPLWGPDDSPASLITAYIDPARRGEGVGTVLADHLEELAVSRGCTRLVVVSGARSRDVGYGFWASRYGRPALVEPDRFGLGAERVAWSVPLPRGHTTDAVDHTLRLIRWSNSIARQFHLPGAAFRWTSGHTARIDADRGVMAARLGEGAWRMAAALRHLAGAGIGTASIHAADGDDVISLDGCPAIILDHVDGRAPNLDRRDITRLGAALGRLHALGHPQALEVRTAAAGLEAPGQFYRAQMLPSNECKALGHERLRSDADPWLAAVVAAADAILDDFADCPQVLLHGDAHPWNALITPGGEAVWIDWDSAGPGAAIADLGFLLLSAATGPLTHPPTGCDLELVDAALEGYAAHRRLTPIELERLEGAVRFRALVFVIGRAADALRRGETPSPDGWWDRCELARDIAARARR